MAAYLFAFMACALAAIGARDQMRVVHLTVRMGRHGGLLLVALIGAAASSAAAAYASRAVLPLAPYAPTRTLLAALALAVAGLESLIQPPRQPPREPTRSLVAALIVLLADQLTDSARMLVLAVALVTQAPVPAGAGGAVGCGAALALGWWWAPHWARAQQHLLLARRIAGGGLVLVAIGLALRVYAAQAA